MRGKTLSTIFIAIFLLLLLPITVSSFAGAQQEQTKTLYRLQGERIPFYQIAGLTIQKDTAHNQTIFIPQPSVTSLTEIETQLGLLSGTLISYFPGSVENPLRPIQEKWLGEDDPPIYLLNNQPVQIAGKANPGYFVVVYPEKDNALRNVLQARGGVPRQYQQTYRFVGFIEAQYIQPVQVEIPKSPDYTRVDPESLSQILLKKEEKAVVVEGNVITAGFEDAQFFLNPSGWIEKVAKERGLTAEETEEFKKLNSGLSVVVPGYSKLKLPARKEEIPVQVVQAEQKAKEIVGEAWEIHDISDWSRATYNNAGISWEMLDRPYETSSGDPICVTIHDGAVESRNPPIWDLIRGLATKSAGTKTRSNIGYTYVIDEKGDIYKVQKEYITVHTVPYEINSQCIGVSATTTYNQGWLPWNDKQNETMIKLVAYWVQKWGIDSIKVIKLNKTYNGAVIGHFEDGVSGHEDPVRYNPASKYHEPGMNMDKFRQMIVDMPEVSEPTIIIYDEKGDRIERQSPTVQQPNPKPTATQLTVGENKVFIENVELDPTSRIKWIPKTVSRWEGLITEKAKAYGVDPIVAEIVMLVESCGHPGLTSTSNAQSLMQVMPFNAHGKNLSKPDENIEAGFSYLSAMYAKFGNWLDAAMAYNAGPGGVASWKKGGYVKPEAIEYRELVEGLLSEVDLPKSKTLEKMIVEKRRCIRAINSPGPEDYGLK